MTGCLSRVALTELTEPFSVFAPNSVFAGDPPYRLGTVRRNHRVCRSCRLEVLTAQPPRSYLATLGPAADESVALPELRAQSRQRRTPMSSSAPFSWCFLLVMKLEWLYYLEMWGINLADAGRSLYCACWI